jgi:predicted thioesterase
MDDMTARAVGSGDLDVFATPYMIALMEAAAVSAVAPVLERGYSTVGIEVNVRHLSATPLGETITAIAEISEINGKSIKFQVRAWDEQELIGEGTHTRYLINVENFLARLHSKAD